MVPAGTSRHSGSCSSPRPSFAPVLKRRGVARIAEVATGHAPSSISRVGREAAPHRPARSCLVGAGESRRAGRRFSRQALNCATRRGGFSPPNQGRQAMKDSREFSGSPETAGDTSSKPAFKQATVRTVSAGLASIFEPDRDHVGEHLGRPTVRTAAFTSAPARSYLRRSVTIG